MRIVDNKATFVRLDGSSIKKGLYLVIALNKKQDRLLMNAQGQLGWVSEKEMQATFFEGNHFDINTFLDEMKKSLYAEARG